MPSPNTASVKPISKTTIPKGLANSGNKPTTETRAITPPQRIKRNDILEYNACFKL